MKKGGKRKRKKKKKRVNDGHRVVNWEYEVSMVRLITRQQPKSVIKA